MLDGHPAAGARRCEGSTRLWTWLLAYGWLSGTTKTLDAGSEQGLHGLQNSRPVPGRGIVADCPLGGTFSRRSNSWSFLSAAAPGQRAATWGGVQNCSRNTVREAR